VTVPTTSAPPTFGRSWILLGLALLWSGVTVAVLLGYHVPEPLGMTSITTNGHTYLGDPPALTLFQRDPVSFAIITGTLGAGLLVALLDLIVRCMQRSPRFGNVAIGAGGVVLLISLFGLLLGLLGVGVAGGLLIASGFPQKRRVLT
jgi:hypothetical protein